MRRYASIYLDTYHLCIKLYQNVKNTKKEPDTEISSSFYFYFRLEIECDVS